MTSDDMHFLDVLSSIPNDILHYSVVVTNVVERNIDQAALAVRERLSSATWLPPSARPSPPPAPVSVVAFQDPHGYYSGNILWRSYTWSVKWVSEHRAITAAIIAFAGTGGWLLYKRKKDYVRKRRAKRGPNGTRKEVVVVAGTPNAPIQRSIVLDLERRGFIVYVVVSSSREEDSVKGENKTDILPLHLNVTDPFDVQATLQNFTSFLANPYHNTPTSSTVHQNPAEPEGLQLAGLVLIPDLQYPSGPLETTSLDLWSDTLNTRLLHTIATTQAFLPLLIATNSRLLLLNPSLIQNLRPPFYTLQSTICAALSAFVASLRAELATLDVSVAEVRLGIFDLALAGTAKFGVAGSNPQAQHMQLQRTARSIVLEWSADARARYARNYRSLMGLGDAGTGLLTRQHRGSAAATSRGTPLRELHNIIFDILATAHPVRTSPWSVAGWQMPSLTSAMGGPSGVYRVGRGSYVYEVFGRWAPDKLINWMMGVRRNTTNSGLEMNGGSGIEDNSDVGSKSGAVRKIGKDTRIPAGASSHWERV